MQHYYHRHVFFKNMYICTYYIFTHVANPIPKNKADNPNTETIIGATLIASLNTFWGYLNTSTTPCKQISE